MTLLSVYSIHDRFMTVMLIISTRTKFDLDMYKKLVMKIMKNRSIILLVNLASWCKKTISFCCIDVNKHERISTSITENSICKR